MSLEISNVDDSLDVRSIMTSSDEDVCAVDSASLDRPSLDCGWLDNSTDNDTSLDASSDDSFSLGCVVSLGWRSLDS